MRKITLEMPKFFQHAPNIWPRDNEPRVLSEVVSKTKKVVNATTTTMTTTAETDRAPGAGLFIYFTAKNFEQIIPEGWLEGSYLKETIRNVLGIGFTALVAPTVVEAGVIYFVVRTFKGLNKLVDAAFSSPCPSCRARLALAQQQVNHVPLQHQ